MNDRRQLITNFLERTQARADDNAAAKAELEKMLATIGRDYLAVEQKLDEIRRLRDRMIRTGAASGIPYARLGKLAGITAQRAQQIAAGDPERRR